MKKKIVQKNLEWATAHLYCKKKNCIAEIVQVKLQYKSVLKLVGLYCNRVQSYCRDTGWEGSVSRYNFCIVTGATGQG